MGSTLLVDLRDIDRLVEDLERFGRKGVPFAARKMLNKAAFTARTAWQERMGEDFLLRNKWTSRSVRVIKASGSNPDSMVSEVGTALPYMRVHEYGGRNVGKSGGAKPIQTAATAGQTGPRPTKPVRRANWLANIKLGSTRKRAGKSKAQRNAIAIRMAIKNGKRFVLLEQGDGGKGIASIGGVRARARGGRRSRLRLRYMWDLSNRSVPVKKTGTLAKTLEHITPSLVPMYRQELLAQLQFHKTRGHVDLGGD